MCAAFSTRCGCPARAALGVPAPCSPLRAGLVHFNTGGPRTQGQSRGQNSAPHLPPRLQLTLRSAPEPPAPRPGRLSVQSAEAQRTKLRCNSFCDVLTSPPNLKLPSETKPWSYAEGRENSLQGSQVLRLRLRRFRGSPGPRPPRPAGSRDPNVQTAI